MATAQELFNRLLEQLKKSAKFGHAASLLAWDHKTYMPSGAADGRAEMIATVETECFKIFTSDTTGEIFESLSSPAADLNPSQKLLFERARAMYRRQKKIPADFFESFSLVKSRAQTVWVEAKHGSDFRMFQPYLEEIFIYVRQLTEIHGYQESPYDALLPDYEPGMTTQQLKKIMKGLEELKSLVRTLTQKSPRPNDTLLSGHFPEEKQKELCLMALEAVGYDMRTGRLDRSEHPFTITVGPDDTRLTTNFRAWTWIPALFAALHEAGHGMYDQGRDGMLRWFYQDSGYSLGIHESQSRLWENMVGRSLPFWKFFYPKLQSFFPYYSQIALADFYPAVNSVKASPIRTQADEVTYNLHIMLRFEIEEALLKRSLEVRDLPGFWNQKIKEYLNIVPKNDAEGVLQDIHWSGGMVGYFPTYMLGNLYAAQLYQAAQKDLPNLEQEFEKGRFGTLLSWLRERVHRFGLVEEAPKLIQRITGQEPSSRPWLEYIKTKFGQIYNLNFGAD